MVDCYCLFVLVEDEPRESKNHGYDLVPSLLMPESNSAEFKRGIAEIMGSVLSEIAGRCASLEPRTLPSTPTRIMTITSTARRRIDSFEHQNGDFIVNLLNVVWLRAGANAAPQRLRGYCAV